MRDINRIDPFMEHLTQLWKKFCPDWRFFQLMSNIDQSDRLDPFYLEDEEAMAKIERFFYLTFPNVPKEMLWYYRP